MQTVAVIQARMGSSRLPGKMMFQLGERPVISHVIQRIKNPIRVDNVVLATTVYERDDILVNQAERHDIDIYRGPESDVLKRMYDAATTAGADIVVRVCADNPLISPDCIETAVSHLRNRSLNYCSFDQSVPIGLGAEAFTMDSFTDVESSSDKAHEREHVTVFYKENTSWFDLEALAAEDVFKEPEMFRNSDARLTLDMAADYELLRRVYQNVELRDDGIVDVHDAISYIEDSDLTTVNNYIEQKNPKDNE